ncbi:MAG: lytic transglycosylase domain-containing protein, partial [Nocardioides sp.]
CHLSWQLLAAIGRIESDHGRFGGSALDASGVAVPAILGPALNGAGKTAVILDTDAGQFDDDIVHDRAVGPMQFIPATWSALGVDADGDGTRNPQDIDDAALAAAVYLCSGGEDLAIGGGRRTAIYRYNHSQAYVDLVLQVARDYRDGDYATSGAPVLNAGAITALPVAAPPAAPLTPTHTPDAVEPPSTTQPTRPPKPVVAQAKEQEHDEQPVEEQPGEEQPEPGTLTRDEAVEYCTELGHVDDPEVEDDEFDACVVEFTAPEEPDPTEPAPTEPTPTGPAPTEPAPTGPAPTEPTQPPPTEPGPTESGPTDSPTEQTP